MTLIDYWAALGWGGSQLVLTSLPLLFAAVVAVLPGVRPRRKLLFVVVCGVIVFGLSAVAYVIQLPVELAATMLAPQWDSEGKETLAQVFGYSAEYLAWLPLVVIAVATVVVPIWLRRGAWERLLWALPNKPLNSTAAASPPPSDAASRRAG